MLPCSSSHGSSLRECDPRRRGVAEQYPGYARVRYYVVFSIVHTNPMHCYSAYRIGGSCLGARRPLAVEALRLGLRQTIDQMRCVSIPHPPPGILILHPSFPWSG